VTTFYEIIISLLFAKADSSLIAPWPIWG